MLMNEIITNIQDTVNKKAVQAACRKLLKKCSFKSTKDVGVIVDLALWLYLYGYYEESIAVCELVKDIEFNGNYTFWDCVDHLYCIKARILRERGEIEESKKLMNYVNQYRHPELYKNGIDHFTTTIDYNIQSNLKVNSKAGAKSWRLLKLEMAIAYREAGKFPVPDEELEKIIKNLIEILSQEK